MNDLNMVSFRNAEISNIRRAVWNKPMAPADWKENQLSSKDFNDGPPSSSGRPSSTTILKPATGPAGHYKSSLPCSTGKRPLNAFLCRTCRLQGRNGFQFLSGRVAAPPLTEVSALLRFATSTAPLRPASYCSASRSSSPRQL